MAKTSALFWSVMFFALGVAHAAPILTVDPLTKLPLVPATVGMLGNEPQALDSAMICNSKMQANMYTVLKSSLADTNAWYAAHLSGMKHVHGYGGNRPQDAYFNADGTIVTVVLGDVGADGSNVGTYSVTYYTFQPGISEKLVLGIVHGNFQC